MACMTILILAGCSPATPSSSGEGQTSGARDVVDTLSQRKALEAGRKAGQQIRDIRASENKNLQEVEP